MNRRLQQILDLENITPAKLAEKIGVQPSGISHILSGRNKPSYDFINKLLLHFPNISAEWLITGKGKPYKNQSINSDQNEDENIFRLDEDISMNDNLENQRNYKQKDDFSDFNNENSNDSLNVFNSQESRPSENRQQIVDKQDINKQTTPSQLDKNAINGNTSTITSQFFNNNQSTKPQFNKKVRRITLFYSDGSFEELYPNR